MSVSAVKRRMGAAAIALLAMVLTLAMCLPVQAFAGNSGSYQAPATVASTKDANGLKYVTVGEHRTTVTFGDMLGISNVTVTAGGAAEGLAVTGADDAADYALMQKNDFMGIFGTSVNVNPNPWMANYFHNTWVKATATEGVELENNYLNASMVTVGAGPMAADTQVVDAYGVSATMAMRPDIVFGYWTSGKDKTDAYATQVEAINNKQEGVKYVEGDETYDPKRVAFVQPTYQYQCSTLMYELADAAQKVIDESKDANGKPTKTTRYEKSPLEIAKDYELYGLGLQDYVLAKIADGTVPRRTVGFVGEVDTDTNTVKFVDTTATVDNLSFRSVDSLRYVADNIIDVKGYNDQVSEGLYVGTPEDVLACDVIVIASAPAEGATKSGVTSTEWAQKLKTVMDASGVQGDMPDVFESSMDGAAAVNRQAADIMANYGVYLGFVYPEIINSVHALCYFFENFYHVSPDSMAQVTGTLLKTMSMRGGVSLADVSTYDSAQVQSIIDTGYAYYLANPDALTAKYPLLKASENQGKTIELTSIATVKCDDFAILENGKAIPELSVVRASDGVALVEGTDYELTLSDNTAVGTGKYEVKGKGLFTGSVKGEFSVVTVDPRLAEVAGTAAKAAAEGGMTDLDANEWYMGSDKGGFFPNTKTLYLDYALAKGLMSGYKDDNGNVTGFGPNDKLSRAQGAVIVYRMANPTATDTLSDAAAKDVKNTSGMTDVENGKYYTAAVNWAVKNNVITGYTNDDGTPKNEFGPDDPISREQLATIIARYRDPKGTAGNDVSKFKDALSISSWAKAGVAYCDKNGIMTGQGDSGNFDPQGTATRCQMAKVIAVTDFMGQSKQTGQYAPGKLS